MAAAEPLALRVEEGAAGSSFRPTLVLMSGRGLAFLATFFIPVFLARLFDQATFGTYRQIFLIYGTVYIIAQAGMAESLFYFVPRDGRAGGAYVANALLALSASAIASGALLWLGGPWIAGLLSNPALAGDMGLAALFIGLAVVSSPLEMVMVARKSYRPAAVAYASSDVLRAVCLIVPAAAWGSLRALLAGAIAFALCRAAAVFIYVRHAFGFALAPDRAALRVQLGYAVPFAVAVVLDIIQSTFHLYAVSYYFDAAAFAVYSVGCLTIPLVDLVAGPTGNVMMVRMTEARATGRSAGVLPIWHDTTRKLALVVAPLVGVSIVTAHALITLLFTPRYAASVPIFIVWSTGILWAALMTDGVLRVHADTRFILFLSGLKLAVNILLMAAFIDGFGLLGAVLVTLTATAAAKLAALARVRRLLGVTRAELLPWRALAAVGAAAALAAVPALLVSGDLPPFIVLLSRGTAYGCAYAVLVVLLGGLSRAEWDLLQGGLRRWGLLAPRAL